jgi:hypothetical protein
MSWTASDTAGLSFVVGVLLLAALAVAAVTAGRATNRATLMEQNGYCAQQGGLFVLGQDGSRICIDPRAIKWRRAPP